MDNVGKPYLTHSRGLLEEMAWQTGAVITGINFKKQEEGWILVVKARSAQRGEVVAFFGGHDPDDCLDTFWKICSCKPGVGWKEDKYSTRPYVKRIDEGRK